MNRKLLFLLPILFALLFAISVPAFGQDSRFGRLRTLDDQFPFQEPQSLELWNKERENIRIRILVSNGLWPLPNKVDLKPIVHHPIERNEYTVHGVILETLPGLYLTGSLYVPKNPPKDEQGNPMKMPGVLSPHGHFENGRFHKHKDEDFAKELESGAEKHDPGGKHPLQARCATLARLGCVVFHYDMIGYADNLQLAHRPGVREEMNTHENWGFFSPQAELRLQNMMGLQTYNTLCALDWLETLPQVDPKRLGVTGASGGGTQTFLISAIDDRIAVQFPAVMVSTAMQGGCLCENAPYLRVHDGNVHFAALFAPKPLGMTAADDWTREMESVGFPSLKKLYALYEKETDVELFPYLNFGHNYNFVSRNAMYRFLSKHLNLGHEFADDEEVEKPFEPLSMEELTVWTGDQAKPQQTGDDFERNLCREIDQRNTKLLAGYHPKPKDKASLEKFRTVYGKALEVMIGRTLEDSTDTQFIGNFQTEKFPTPSFPMQDPFGFRFETEFINRKYGESVPAVMLVPQSVKPDQFVVFVSGIGKKGMYDAKGDLRPFLQKSLTDGKIVIIPDLYGQGSNSPTGEPLTQSDVADPKQYLGYTLGYNHSVFAKRVHDILSITAALKKYNNSTITLYGTNGGAPLAASARAIAGKSVNRLIVNTEKFRFAKINALDDLNMLPGIVKYGDLPAILALSAPHPLEVQGETAQELPLVRNAYDAAEAGKEFAIAGQ